MTHAPRPKARTWSLLGDVRRKPSPYEAVTARFQYTFRREPAPFELDRGAPLNQWYLAHREGSAFQVPDWEGFRDPHRLTYKDYVTLQHEREVHTDLLIDEHEAARTLHTLDPAWVTLLRRLVVPLRFPLHVLQMTASYTAHMAPSAFITNCAAFQAADEARRIQRLAYWTRALANAHDDDLAATATARSAWEEDPAWQPLRRVLEELLTVPDWGEAFTALNLVVKPALDILVDESLAGLAQDNGDAFLADLCTEFSHDARRSRDWTRALVRYALDQRPDHAELLRDWADARRPDTEQATAALAALFAQAPVPAPPEEVRTAIAVGLTALHTDGGLRTPS
ncbi:hypothetical protein [Streptomyces sp. NPDC048659]|uniref:hypothetical protein n=1 Tax=Streptomyces sp. NPDC048659 TaxID=3155489 RepID=UPI00343070E1